MKSEEFFSGKKRPVVTFLYSFLLRKDLFLQFITLQSYGYRITQVISVDLFVTKGLKCSSKFCI